MGETRLLSREQLLQIAMSWFARLTVATLSICSEDPWFICVGDGEELKHVYRQFAMLRRWAPGCKAIRLPTRNSRLGCCSLTGGLIPRGVLTRYGSWYGGSHEHFSFFHFPSDLLTCLLQLGSERQRFDAVNRAVWGFEVVQLSCKDVGGVRERFGVR